jgi:hypothetical protein
MPDPLFPESFQQPEPISESILDRLRSATLTRVQAEALPVYARWWQLETWLRTLVRIELCAAKGSAWAGNEAKKAVERELRDDYMASPDSEDYLSQLTTGKLLEIVDNNYQLFESSLFRNRERWRLRAQEANAIRRRIAHCRRPHSDDLARLEQLLRDLEPGARRAVNAYNDIRTPDEGLNDQVIRDWVKLERLDAKRLVPHGWDNKGIGFRLEYSIRPWAKWARSGARISGRPGAIWHMSVSLRERYLPIEEYWLDDYVQRVADQVLHVLSFDPYQLRVTIPAKNPATKVSDAIRWLFEAVFSTSRPGRADNEAFEAHRRRAARLDPRVLVDHMLVIVDSSAPPLSLFEA